MRKKAYSFNEIIVTIKDAGVCPRQNKGQPPYIYSSSQ